MERLKSTAALPKQDQLASHGNENESLTPLQHAQLVAKKVACSTGEAVGRLRSRLDQNNLETGEGPKLGKKSSATVRSHHHTTPKRSVALDTHKLDHVDHDEDLSPLERAELTAQRVAKSTGKSLEKLSKSEHALQHSIPLCKQKESIVAEIESERSDSECSTTSETEPDSLDLDHLSSLERVKHTAEIVADSTSMAVQRLTSSLSDSI